MLFKLWEYFVHANIYPIVLTNLHFNGFLVRKNLLVLNIRWIAIIFFTLKHFALRIIFWKFILLGKYDDDVRDELAVTSHKVYEIIIEKHEIKEWINADWSTLTFIYVCILKGIRMLVQRLDSPTIFHAIWKWCVCLFDRPTRMETSPLPVKGCKFWPMLGTHGYWEVRDWAVMVL